MMKKHKTFLGGLKPSSQNSAEIDSIVRFAVLEHNKKQVLIITLIISIDIICEQLVLFTCGEGFRPFFVLQ